LLIELGEIDEEMQEHQSREKMERSFCFGDFCKFIYPLIIKKSSCSDNNLNKDRVKGNTENEMYEVLLDLLELRRELLKIHVFVF
jgi:hypothetical protein